MATDEPGAAPDGSADVVLTFAHWDAGSASVQVGGYVGGLIEDGGTCTLTLTNGSQSLTVTAAASADASTTICGPLTVPGSQLAPGSWRTVVTYHSATTTGTSDPAEVTVP